MTKGYVVVCEDYFAHTFIAKTFRWTHGRTPEFYRDQLLDKDIGRARVFATEATAKVMRTRVDNLLDRFCPELGLPLPYIMELKNEDQNRDHRGS